MGKHKKYIGNDFKYSCCRDKNYIVQCPCSTTCNVTFPRVNKFGYIQTFAKYHAIKTRDQKGEKNTQWKGGVYHNEFTGYDYIRVPDHPFQNNGYVPLHRYVMEQHLSKLAGEEVYIPSELDINHINRNKTDNRIENLEILSHGAHTTFHNEVDKTGWYCYDCKTTEGKIRNGGRIEWRNHPFIEGEHLCTRCVQKSSNKELIICIDCNEQKKKYCKGLCEKCHNRRTSEGSPVIKCKMSGCDNTFHKLDTNGKKREYCRACRLRVKRNARLDSKTKG